MLPSLIILGLVLGGCPPAAVRGAARRGVAGHEAAEPDPGIRRLTLKRRRLAACWSCSARLSVRGWWCWTAQELLALQAGSDGAGVCRGRGWAGSMLSAALTGSWS